MKLFEIKGRGEWEPRNKRKKCSGKVKINEKKEKKIQN